jgi:hypothetical protein
MKPLQRLLVCICFLASTAGNAQIITTVAGCGMCSSLGDGGSATAAYIDYFAGVAIDSHENIYIADGNNHRVRKIDYVTNIITTIAGNGSAGFSGDGGPASNAQLNLPTWVIVDTLDNIYITDGYNNRVRKVNSSGVISTFAGNGVGGFSGDGGPATNAQLYGVQGTWADLFGNVYIIDGANPRIRKVDVSGVITTIAGTGFAGFSGDGGPATAALLNGPSGICGDQNGNIFFVDASNHRVRRIDATTNLFYSYSLWLNTSIMLW